MLNLRSIVSLLLIACVLFACASCKTGGTYSAGPIVGGAAAALAVVDQLLAADTITPVQHLQFSQGITQMATLAEQAVAVANDAKVAVASAKAGTLTTEQTVGVAGTAATVAAAALNAWRNRTRSTALQGVTLQTIATGMQRNAAGAVAAPA